MNSEKMEGEERKEEEEEEEKMKKFYVLIENIRATRMLWQTAPPSKRQKRESLLWKPSFEWEDFSQAVMSSSNVGDGGKSKGKEKEEGTERGVDLSLGL
ncbi:hypothetical protein MA16_Dca023429 [Dendrobium catenatum]|uniref:Uncharacterized protein n=2 Tax=Dendrobium catenatum TaxID=906689 RepID=A0A2I0W6P7_9ASPA|nr:hypothetical protein MA16_Dca023429 [Dendrobium catenatum]